MGDTLKTAGGAMFGGPLGASLAGGTGGVNKLLSPLGLGGEQGDYFSPQMGNASLDQMNSRTAATGWNPAAEARMNYANGGSLKDYESFGKNSAALQGTGQLDQYMSDLATDPITGSKFATEQVQGNPILSKLFGNGGQLDKTIQSADDAGTYAKGLQDRGYSMQPEDYEAYGQASGNIARQYGSQENSLAQSLANRGLASAPSGAAGVAFTGLAGNKSEQLAGAQTQIANLRMQNNLDRLKQAQSFQVQQQGLVGDLGKQGEAAIQDQYGRQLSGAKLKSDELNSAGTLQNSANNMANTASLASTEDKRGAKGQTLFDAIGQGLYAGTAKTASKGPGMLTGMAGG